MATVPLERHEEGRRAGVEMGRVVAMFFVVYIHTRAAQSGLVGQFLNVLAEFAVPYFFVAAGYFFAKKIQAPGKRAKPLLAFCARLLMLMLVWSAVYSLIPLDWPVALSHGELMARVFATASAAADKLALTPLDFVFDGPPGGFHLWFLPSLMLSAVLLWLFVRLDRVRLGGLCAILMFGMGLVCGRYQNAPLGMAIDFNMRNGPFQAFLLFYAGYCVYAFRVRSSIPIALLLLLGGLCASVLESLWLSRFTAPPASVFGYSMAVLPLGLGAFLLFLNISSPYAASLWVRLGKYVLYVYLIHVILRAPVYMVLYKFAPFLPGGAVLLAVFLTSFGLSALFVEAQRRMPLKRGFATVS